jgi:FKBP-type peptidyl-prolyl cis-trans isomerase
MAAETMSAKRQRDEGGSPAAAAETQRLSKRARKALQKHGKTQVSTLTKQERKASLQTEDMTRTRAADAKAARTAAKKTSTATANSRPETLPGGQMGPVMKKKARRGKGGGAVNAVANPLKQQGSDGKPKAWTFKDRGKLSTAPRDNIEPSLNQVMGKPEITGPVTDPETGITSLPGGLQYLDVKAGSVHKQIPKDGKPLTIKYRGVVQQENQSSKPVIPFAKGMLTWWLGSGDVIVGLDHGVRGMRAGGMRKLIVPPSMAYGEAGDGTDGKIPPNATLLFDVKLVRVGTKAEELQAEEKALERQNRQNAHRMISKPSGRGMMPEMGHPSQDTGVIAMPLPSELCKKGRNRSGVPKKISAWKEKRRRKTGKAASEQKNKRGGAGDFEKGYTRRGGGR